MRAAVREASVLELVDDAVDPLMMLVPFTVMLFTDVLLLPEKVIVAKGVADSARLHSL
jgi:hypothetical protein